MGETESEQMEEHDAITTGDLPQQGATSHRLRYDARMATMRAEFERSAREMMAGVTAIRMRSAAVDELVIAVWGEIAHEFAGLERGIALVAVGGYGREELFPCSDVDLMFLLDARVAEKTVKEPIRRVNQMLWDAGLRVATMTRSVSECEHFDPQNVEFTLSLLDARGVAGDAMLTSRLIEHGLAKLLARDAREIQRRLREVTENRHAKYGETLFHLEPNIKECPGGLRDAHVCEWMRRLGGGRLIELQSGPDSSRALPDSSRALPDWSRALPDWSRALEEARRYLSLVRVFLHLRHGRDDNVLNWQAQDAAAAASVGAGQGGGSTDAAHWMRRYFREARSVDRGVRQLLDQETGRTAAGRDEAGRNRTRGRSLVRRALALKNLRGSKSLREGFEVRQNRIYFLSAASEPAHDPEIVLTIFATMANQGVALSVEVERRIEDALPVLSAQLEDGPNLWQRLQEVLLGGFAGMALRAMHALGILELVIPEFHGIDALVIRDAYHRYTVDEHTFVAIDTLHGLAAAEKPEGTGSGRLWRGRFGQLFRELPHPELLLLAALLHDTGKGHAAANHAAESARMAANVLARLELDHYETDLVLELIRNHLEMSVALRRDVFDRETVRSFAARVPNPELLRMLTLFTYADIAAVHPDALTDWKAENLWRLYLATTSYLDRSVDDERVGAEANNELLLRIHAVLPRQRERVNFYLDGFPQRYLQTRAAETVKKHFDMASSLHEDASAIELDFRYEPGLSELTLITRDRPMLFASLAGALAGWGMNIVAAEAFSNAHGIVVDSFRFHDMYRTLELNVTERERFVRSVRDVVVGEADLEALLASRRRGRRKVAKIQVDARVEFDDTASSQSTLMQVLAQDTPGLLRAVSLTLAEQGCNIEVALVDTEGETAIDVFYVTQGGSRLGLEQQARLRSGILEAIEQNAR